ncbi:hypothetical protein R3P38DRAFT_3448220 [Favolaschia claudopus]|uniref:Hydroxyneurosporene synthase n=1 Tax=Favolaschia claudopus TaxID=2862362 RepID=A0AAW0CTN7_9AGAR
MTNAEEHGPSNHYAAATPGRRQVFHVPSTIQTGASIAQFEYSSQLDAPKLSTVNGSVFDWWYFDVVSADTDNLATAVVILYTTSHDAFPFLDPFDGALPAQIVVTFPNGTLVSTQLLADSATIIAEDDYSSGEWDGTGIKWSGQTSGYTVIIDSPIAGVKGSITFQPVAPAHLPCAPVQAGETLEVAPHIGWSNAIPDSKASVNLVINGTSLAFEGIGYHDKNWSDEPFFAHVASWYWGHAHVGPYSLVWFDFLDLTGKEFVSAYVAQDGKIVTATCAADSISVRPTGSGNGSMYPPVVSIPNPAGYHISLDLGLEKGRMEADVHILGNLVELGDSPVYGRFIANVSARIASPSGGNGEEFQGMALCEQFKLTN